MADIISTISSELVSYNTRRMYLPRRHGLMLKDALTKINYEFALLKKWEMVFSQNN